VKSGVSAVRCTPSTKVTVGARRFVISQGLVGLSPANLRQVRWVTFYYDNETVAFNTGESPGDGQLDIVPAETPQRRRFSLGRGDDVILFIREMMLGYDLGLRLHAHVRDKGIKVFKTVPVTEVS